MFINSGITNENIFNFRYPTPTYLQFNKVFKPKNKDELQTAINELVSDYSKYGNINRWDTSLITDMSGLFKDKQTFNENISNWNVSSVINMEGMFKDASNFDQNISNWNVSNVINMEGMFKDASNFDQNMSNWNVSNVPMRSMFENAKKLIEILDHGMSQELLTYQDYLMVHLILIKILDHGMSQELLTYRDYLMVHLILIKILDHGMYQMLQI